MRIPLGAGAMCVAVALGCACAGPRGAAQPIATIAPVAAPVPKAARPVLRADGDWAQRHERIVAEASRGGHEVVFIGASIIERWATVGKDSWNAVWAPRHAVDCGIGGDRTQHVIGRLDGGLLDALAAPNNHVQWVVLNIGANNTRDDSSADIAAGTMAIIQRLHDRLPEARIVLMLLLPWGQWPNPQRDVIVALNERLPAMLAGDDRVRVLDITGRFVKPTGEVREDLLPDFEHPSPAGYRLWSERLVEIMNAR